MKNRILILYFIKLICSMSYQEFMTLSDEDIWSGSNRFGNCAIVDQRTASGSCDYYIKKNDITGQGLPDGIGSGCLKAPISSCPTCYKNVDVCWTSSNYDKYDNTWPICTSNHKKNGANMIRIGVLNGYCNITNYQNNRTLSSCINTTSNSSSSSSNTTNSTSSVDTNYTCQCNCVYSPTQAVTTNTIETKYSYSSQVLGLLIGIIILTFIILLILIIDIYQKHCKKKRDFVNQLYYNSNDSTTAKV